MSDGLQLINLALFTAILTLALRRRLYDRYWLAALLMIAHYVLFYGVVVVQNAGLISGIPTMGWSVALRLQLAIVLFGYLVWGRGK